MKKSLHLLLLLLVLFAVSSLPSLAQRSTYVLDLAPISESASVTDIFLSSSMLKSSKLDFKDTGIPSLDELFLSTRSLRIFTTEDPNGVMLMKDTFAPICDGKNSSYETFFSIKSDGAIVRLIGKVQGDRLEEIYLLVDDREEIVAIIFQGDYSHKQINKMVSEAMNNRSHRKQGQQKNKKMDCPL